MNMRPSFSMVNSVNGRTIDVISLRNLKARNTIHNQFSFLSNIFFAENRHSMTDSKRLASASFFLFVLHIIEIGSKAQMRRTNAQSVVALMKHLLPFWNFTNANNPTKSVREIKFSKNIQSAVSVLNGFTFPVPAISQFWTMRLNLSVFINFFKESNSRSFSTMPISVEKGIGFVNDFVSKFAHLYHGLICQVCGWLKANHEPISFSLNLKTIQLIS